MTRFSLNTWLTVILLTALIGLMIAVTRLRLPAIRLDTVTVELTQRGELSQRGEQLDSLLLANIQSLADQHALRQQLAANPERTVSLRSFWMDHCEVSQKQFEEFALWRQKQLAASGDNIRQMTSISQGHRIAGRLVSPATGISYPQAFTYCRAAGGNLPSSEQWQAAAGNKQGRLYPWGDRFDSSAWPYTSPIVNAAQRCGLHPKNDTPEGVHDMVSGAEEWTSGKERPLIHGSAGGVALPVRALTAIYRESNLTERSHQLGFRCVYSRAPRGELPWGGHYSAVRFRAGEYVLGLPRDSRISRLAAVLSPAALKIYANTAANRREKLLPALDVGRCEITRRQYQLFLQDPLVRLGLFASDAEPEDLSYIPKNWDLQQRQPDLPVSGVNWWAANSFARWLGGRLPTAEEWDLIVSGTEISTYPWGNEIKPNQVMTGNHSEAKAVLCGRTSGDLSHTRLWDAGGNLSEWTRSLTVDGRNFKAWVKGGSFLLPPESSKLGFGRVVPLHHGSDDIGFRVVFD